MQKICKQYATLPFFKKLFSNFKALPKNKFLNLTTQIKFKKFKKNKKFPRTY